MNKNIRKLTDLFFFDQDTNKPDISNYGKYRLGLTAEEVKIYLTVRAYQHQKQFTKKLEKKYYEIAGVNTCAVVDGQVLYYRHDILRFSDELFDDVKTFFD